MEKETPPEKDTNTGDTKLKLKKETQWVLANTSHEKEMEVCGPVDHDYCVQGPSKTSIEEQLAENQDSPKENQDSPKENQDSPKENQDSPKENQDSPKENQDSPKENQDSPKEKPGQSSVKTAAKKCGHLSGSCIDESTNQAIALKYRGFLSRRKYDVQCRTLTSVFDPNKKMWLLRSVKVDGVDVRSMRQLSHYKLDRFVKSIDIGSLYHLPRELGVTRRVSSRDLHYLLHLVIAEETDAVMADLWQQHTEEMALLEGSTFTINVSRVTFEFVPSADQKWQCWTNNETIDSATCPSPFADVSKHTMDVVGGFIWKHLTAMDSRVSEKGCRKGGRRKEGKYCKEMRKGK
ncbi:hypothetical protein Bbelb_272480 [Branchiostoma belcheri]|nr:hypothetical protein Bbelb_272480 [Branchiostoma belcheri]